MTSARSGRPSQSTLDSGEVACLVAWNAHRDVGREVIGVGERVGPSFPTVYQRPMKCGATASTYLVSSLSPFAGEPLVDRVVSGCGRPSRVRFAFRTIPGVNRAVSAEPLVVLIAVAKRGMAPVASIYRAFTCSVSDRGADIVGAGASHPVVVRFADGATVSSGRAVAGWEGADHGRIVPCDLRSVPRFVGRAVTSRPMPRTPRGTGPRKPLVTWRIITGHSPSLTHSQGEWWGTGWSLGIGGASGVVARCLLLSEGRWPLAVIGRSPLTFPDHPHPFGQHLHRIIDGLRFRLCLVSSGRLARACEVLPIPSRHEGVALRRGLEPGASRSPGESMFTGPTNRVALDGAGFLVSSCVRDGDRSVAAGMEASTTPDLRHTRLYGTLCGGGER